MWDGTFPSLISEGTTFQSLAGPCWDGGSGLRSYKPSPVCPSFLSGLSYGGILSPLKVRPTSPNTVSSKAFPLGLGQRSCYRAPPLSTRLPPWGYRQPSTGRKGFRFALAGGKEISTCSLF